MTERDTNLPLITPRAVVLALVTVLFAVGGVWMGWNLPSSPDAANTPDPVLPYGYPGNGDATDAPQPSTGTEESSQ